MTRIVLVAAAAVCLLILPATAHGDSAALLRGAVASKSPAAHLVSVRTSRRMVGLRVPGSLAAIRIDQRVELRGSTLRARDGSAKVLARNVTVVGRRAVAPSTSTAGNEDADDEVEITGTLTSLSPVMVRSSTRTVSCQAPAGLSLSGFAIGDLVEITCDLKGGAWVVRKLEHEDEDDDEAEADDDDDHGGNSGPGSVGDEDDDDHSGPGHGGDDDDGSDDDHGANSGPGGGDDD